MVGHLYFPRPGDRELITEKKEMYSKCEKQELIDIYNEAYKLGFVGVHAQACHYIALAQVFKVRFGSHPFKITDNALIEFSGKIKATESGWENVALT
jgi:hypothetical protein